MTYTKYLLYWQLIKHIHVFAKKGKENTWVINLAYAPDGTAEKQVLELQDATQGRV